MSKCKCASNGNEFNPPEPEPEPEPAPVRTLPYKSVVATPKPIHTNVEKPLFGMFDIMDLNGNIVNVMICIVVIIVMVLLLYKS